MPKLGAKAYEQCAGFIRVPESKNVLDNTGVHPESYDAAKALLELCGLTVKDAAKGNTGALKATVELLGGEKKLRKIRDRSAHSSGYNQRAPEARTRSA